MPVSNRSGGLHKGTLFDTNVPATTIDKDIFTDQEVEDTIAGDDLVLMLDVSEDPDKIKYMTRTNFVAGLSGSTITVTDNESTDEENLITFVADAGSSTGLHGIEMDGNLAYNPSTGTVSATNFSGTSSLATSITATANNSADETVYPTFIDGATGTQGIETDTGLTYNPSSGILTATQFTGAVSGNASTATALAAGRTIGMTGDVVWTSASFDGSGNVTGTATIQANSVALSTDTTGNYVQSIADAGNSTITVTNGTAEGGAVTLDVAAAQTTITSILATDLKIGEDDQTKIDFETPNQINFYADNANQIILQDGVLVPANDNEIDLGTSSTEFKDAYFDGTVTSDAFAGPLTGNASTATALETARTIGGVSFDGTGNINLPGVNTAGNQNTSGTAAVATTVTITDNESTDEANAIVFTAGGDLDGGNLGLESDGTLNYNPSSGTLTTTTFAGALTGNVTGNASGTAATVTGGTQASITNVANVVEVGALNAGSITSGFGTINTGSSTITTSGVITAGGITIGSAAILEAELEIIDGATVTTTELNLLDGDTSVGGSITLADGDGFIVNDGGTMKTIPASDISAYVTAEGAMSNWVLEDDDGTEVTITNTKEIKLIGSGVTTNWTDTDNGTDGDPFDMTITVDAAQTGITSIYATDLILGEDSETAIDFGTANEIDFKINNTTELTLDATALYPTGDAGLDLGTASLEFKDAFFDGTVTSDAFAGPLTGNVTGTADVATVATTVTITDNESTNENNAIIFTAGGDVDGGNLGLESDGDLTYNPSTGLLSSTGVTASGTMTFGSLSDGAITATAFVDEDNMASDSATLIPTQQSVKAYVDSNAGTMSNFILEDDDGTEVTVSNAKEVKLIGSGVTTNWTDTDNGTDGDPYDMTIAVDAAQTLITSIYATDLIMGEDAETAIDFGTANEIDFKVDNAARLTLTSGALYPVTDNQIDLGTSSLEFKDAFFDGTVTADAFAGPLTGNVTGTADVATVATTVTITDNESTDEANAIIFTAGGDLDGGNLGLESDGTLNYNPSSGTVTSTIFSGALSGNSTTATALATGRTIAMTGDVAWTSASFDGSGNVTGAGTIQANAVEGSMLNNNTISGQTEITSGLAAADELLYDDGGVLKKVGLDNFVELTPALATEDAIANGDYILFLDGGATGNMNKEAVHDVATLFAGAGMTATNSVMNVIGGDGITANANDIAITAAQTTITSIYATDLIMGEDAETAIDFGTANEIDFKVDNAARLTLTASALYPVTDNQIDLGTSSLEFKDAFFDGTVTADAFAGPLTGNVTGTADVATVATTVTITDNESTDEDNAITFTAGGDVDGGNIGLESDGTLTYNPSTGKVTATGFVGTLTGNVTGNTSGTAATVTSGTQASITTLANVTTVGALGAGTIAAGFGAIDNGTSGIRTNTFTAETSIVPDAVGGADIGSTSAEWGDVYIADDKKIYLGDGQDVSLEYDEDGTDQLRIAGDTIFENNVNLSDAANVNIATPLLAGTDHTTTGITAQMLAGGAIAAFDLVCIHTTTQEVVEADASAAATSRVIGIAPAAISDTATGTVLLQGFVRDDTWTWTTGSPLYLSETAGAMTHTAPTTDGAFVQVVGVALSPDVVYINPSMDVIEHA